LLQLRLKLVRAVLATERAFHPRFFRLLFHITWPILRNADGMLPAYYGLLELRLDLRECAEREVFLYAYHHLPTMLIPSFIQTVLRAGDVVVDVGANVGQISAIAANCVQASGRVFAVEPNPRLAARLRELANRNPLANLKVLETALGEKDDTLPFYISSSHPYSTLDPKCLPCYPVEGVVSVKVSTLDTLMSQHAGDCRVRLLKIDAQGYENRILKGAADTLALHPPEIILLETVSNGIRDTLADLGEAGYDLFTLREPDAGLVPRPTREWLPPQGMNIIFIHRSTTDLPFETLPSPSPSPPPWGEGRFNDEG